MERQGQHGVHKDILHTCPETQFSNNSYRYMYTRSMHSTWIANTLAEVFIRGVICKPSKLVLHSLRQCRIRDDRVLRLFIREIRIKVGHVQHRLDAGLEWWRVPFSEESKHVL